MKELFYFAFADVLARVEYRRTDNSLHYATHRKMNADERFMIEQYLLVTFSMKTDYHERESAIFVYQGTQPRLTKALDKFRSKHGSRGFGENEKAVNDSVSDLIGRSMENYYFEKIGDMILDARREQAGISTGLAAERRDRRKMKLEELVKAYNVHADQKITIDDIIPAELKSCFDISAGVEHFRAEPAVH